MFTTIKHMGTGNLGAISCEAPSKWSHLATRCDLRFLVFEIFLAINEKSYHLLLDVHGVFEKCTSQTKGLEPTADRV